MRGGDDLWVEQLAQLDPSQKLGQQGGVQRQRGRAPLRQRCVALIHERAHIAEQQRRGERRRRGRLDLDHPHPALLDAGHQGRQGGYVIDVLQAFAHGFENDRKVRVFAGHIEQLRRALALVPERGALAGVAPRQQQRACGAFAEPRREQRRAADFGGDDRFDIVRLEDEQVGPRG